MVNGSGTFIQKAQKGDRKAREIVFQGNCRFVISVAKMYQNNGLPIVDLINEGNIGLLSAIERYDPAREAKFISYAVWWIRQGILDALMKQNYTIALPLNYYSTNLHIERFEEKFFFIYLSQFIGVMFRMCSQHKREYRTTCAGRSA